MSPSSVETTKKYKTLALAEGQYSLAFSEENKLILLSDGSEEIIVGAVGAINPDLQSTLSYYHGKDVKIVQIEHSDFSSRLSKLHALDVQSSMSLKKDDEGFNIETMNGDAPIVNFINGILIDAIRARASDIHIEQFSALSQVRFRIDGALVKITSFSNERFSSISSRIKIMANLNIMEKRLPQDGRVSVDLGHERVDLRVSIVPIAKGESIVIRLLGKNDALLSLQELGMDHAMYDATNRMLEYPHGLILVTGPTGSGKTTTLNAMLRKLRSDTDKIITIEDPIEFVLDGINQIQVHEQIGLTFESLLRRVLRQDPNTIMVGEVRDLATAELVIRASLTGHLVLTTLHTNDSISAISRLQNIGIEPFLIAAVLRSVIAQRLVRKLCPNCKESAEPTNAEKALAESHGIKLTQIWRAVGCEHCRNTGFKGRFAVYEHFMMDQDLEDTIVKGNFSANLRTLMAKKGMKTLVKSGFDRVAEGETTIDELEREVELI